MRRSLIALILLVCLLAVAAPSFADEGPVTDPAHWEMDPHG